MNDELPDDRKAAIAYGLEQYNRMKHELEDATRERDSLRLQLRSAEEGIDSMRSTLNDLESRNRSLQIARDEAVSHRIKWEALFTSINAQLRAFEVPAEPLIREKPKPLPQHEDALASLHKMLEQNQLEEDYPADGDYFARKARVLRDLSRQ